MNRWKVFRRIPSLLWASAPGWTVAATILMVLEIILGLLSLYLIKQLVDSVTVGVSDGRGDFSSVVMVVVLTGSVALVFAVVRGAASYARAVQSLEVADHVDRLIHERATDVDLAFYESPRYYDTLQRARQAGLQRPAQVVSNLLLLAKNAVMLAASVALIANINALIVPVLAVAVIPALLVRIHFTRSEFDWRQHRTQLERRAGYLDWLMTSDAHAKELRLNQLGLHLQIQYADLRKTIRTENLRLSRRRTSFETLVSVAGSLAFFGALAFLANEVAKTRSTVGDLVLFMVVFQRAQGLGQDMVGELVRVYEDALYLGLLYSFLDVRPSLTAPPDPVPIPQPVRQGIRLENVSFQYPGSAAWALQDINIEIKPGQIVALVGSNGSGKTSLIKVLCRLYDPTAGRISIDNVDARAFDPNAYRRLYSVIFQDYSAYASTVRENIHVGAIELPPDSPRIEQVAVAAGADAFIRTLPDGYDTLLGKMFDNGQQLSVGQWQKLALARAFLRSSSLVILDEPTSALDPNSEYELFEDFRARIEGRMALVISHRLSTVRLADMIYVMDAGRIVESGSHADLMKLRGVYADLFSKQGKYFQEQPFGVPL